MTDLNDYGGDGGWRERMAAWHHRVWRRGLMRSGLVTWMVLAVLLLGLGIGYRAHMRGNFHKLKAKMATERPEAPTVRPGGQEALTLTRTALLGSSAPEFLSATMLPGRGMNVLQITAQIPGRGEVKLLASPEAGDAAKAMTGTGSDAEGAASVRLGSPFEAPWAGRIWGLAGSSATQVATAWRGHALVLPAQDGTAEGGLLLARASSSATATALPDGGQAEASFAAGDFGGRWPGSLLVSVDVVLSSRTLEMTLTARNTGEVAEPVGLGWRPRFALDAADRERIRVHVPAERRVQWKGAAGAPTGELTALDGAADEDYASGGGARLDAKSVEECFVGLHQNLLDAGPVTELSFPASGYGLRLTALSPAIKAIRLSAPAGAGYVSLDPSYNYPDPFGREWGKGVDTGMVVLGPGETTQWKVRLEIFSLSSGGL